MRVNQFYRCVIALLVVVCTGCSSVSEASLDLLGRPVPDGRMMLLNGDTVALQGKRGTRMAILFWATWCPYSRSVIEDFEELARRFSEPGRFEFYAVSVDKNEDIEVLRSRIASQDLRTVTHVFSGNDVYDESFLSLKGDHLPYSVFVDARGIVRYVGLGVSGLDDYMSKPTASMAMSASE